MILVSGVCFGVAGGILGFTLGVGTPAYYRGVFPRGNDPGFSPAEVGLGLGLTQGLICGLLIFGDEDARTMTMGVDVARN